MESISRAIYPAFYLEISDNMINLLNKMNFQFIWKDKCHYIRKADMIKSIEEGGLNVIDFSVVLNGVLKLKWLKSFVCHKDAFWFTIPNAIFQKMGGIHFLLRCDYDVYKLPVKLSDFHQQFLLYWKLMFKHNFTPHNTPLWNNRYILSNRKSLFFGTWMEKGIWAVSHLMDNFEYNRVIKAIPAPLKTMIQQFVIYSNSQSEMRSLCIEGINLNSKQFTNKFIRNILSKQKRYLSYPILPKAKEVTFKILNDIYPSNSFLHERFNLI
ncbi:hypothetical protein Q7C36_017361 [Tachysurus vachellii]|uniref:Uncharacterized protein n=1 Tax=Tachysurus vachellii TaxID=175792 RepID=A0AA88M2Y3_TACVA|nr:hypothetical protein Q7C36_017361 [Tachysurus vachellii]